MSQKKAKRRRIEEKITLKKAVESVGEVVSFVKIFKENFKVIILMVLLALGLYANGLGGDFVSDDYATIPQNQLVTKLSHQISKQSGLLNLPTLSNWAVAVVFGNQNPVPYHIFSVGLYLGIVTLLFVVLYLIFGKNLATLATLIYTVMPIHVEGITWISGKPYTYHTLFVLWAMMLSLLYLKTHKSYYFKFLVLLLPWVFFADKVRSFSYITLMGLVLISFKDQFKLNVNWKKIFTFITPMIVVGLIYLWPHILERINVVNTGYNTTESIFYNPFFQYPTAVAKYLQLMWAPVDMTLYHTMYDFPVWLNWAILLTYLFCVIYFYFKNKKIFFALAFIFVAAAPSMAPVKVSWLVAERYMFMGSVGFALFVAIILAEVFYKSKIIAITLGVVLITGYGVRTVMRNDNWNTNHKLWVNTCQVSPNSHNAWNNIGDDYDKLATAATDEKEKLYYLANAIKGFTQSTVVKPNYADAYHNRANIFYKVGRLDLARESYSTALNFSPGLYQTYLSLVQIDLMEKKYDMALQHAMKAVELQPANPQAIYVLGVVYGEGGNIEESKKIMKMLLERYPDYGLARDTLNKLEEIAK